MSSSNSRRRIIQEIAKYIQSDQCSSIVVLTGAGISVASGIPDFRSPGGMYDTLRADLITSTRQEQRLMELDPTYVVSWDIFSQNAFPYLEVRRPFILGTAQQQWKATMGHRFLELLHTKTNKLTRLYTQNIDGLDFQTTIPKNKIVSVHGTIGQVACEGCGAEMDFDQFCQQVESNIKDIYDPTLTDEEKSKQESKPIPCPSCHRQLVKPKTVLFGRSLPEEFWTKMEQDMPKADLLIVAGTSLVVSPANSLVYRVPDDCKRVVVNQEPVGRDLGIDYASKKGDSRDFFAQGDCDQVFFELGQELGWIPDLLTIQDSLPEKSRAILTTSKQS